MRYDQSHGIIPLKKEGERWLVFVIRHRGRGHWTLPKGHPEGTETPLECARRELFEETGLSIVRILFEEPLIETYQFSSRKKPIHKTVNYFVAEVEGDVKIQKEELRDGKWVELAKSHEVVTFDQMKILLNHVINKLESLQSGT